MTNQKPTPIRMTGYEPNSGQLISYFVVASLLVSIAIPAIQYKPWNHIGPFIEKVMGGKK